MLGKACAWLRAATRLLSQGFDALFAAGIGLTSRNGGNRHPALSKKDAGKGSAKGVWRLLTATKARRKAKKSEAISNAWRLLVLTVRL
jgi:hypothetical protein